MFYVKLDTLVGVMYLYIFRNKELLSTNGSILEQLTKCTWGMSNKHIMVCLQELVPVVGCGWQQKWREQIPLASFVHI